MRLGYKLLLQEESNDRPGSFTDARNKKFQKSIWSFKVPNGVKTLLQIAASNSLPSQANLFKRKVVLVLLCQCCGSDQETVHHAIWSCPAMATVWNQHFSWLTKETNSSSNFLDVIQLCLGKSSLTDLLAMTTALIWMRRNRLRVGEPTMPLDRISSTSMENPQEFQRSQLIKEIPKSVPRQYRWKPPPKNQVKINCNGATFAESNLASLGAIICNDKGLVMAAFSLLIPLPTLVEMVEVLATRKAICFAQELNFAQVVCEGDSEIIIKALNSNNFSSSSFRHILQDIKLFSFSFQNSIFYHTRRQGNRATHGLARLANLFFNF